MENGEIVRILLELYAKNAREVGVVFTPVIKVPVQLAEVGGIDQYVGSSTRSHAGDAAVAKKPTLDNLITRLSLYKL